MTAGSPDKIPMPRNPNFDRGIVSTKRLAIEGAGFLGQRDEWVDGTLVIASNSRRAAIVTVSVAGCEIHVWKKDLRDALEVVTDA